MTTGLDIVTEALKARGSIPASGPERVAETHISWVILTADRAYKVKKSVVFPFVNYASASRRRAHCKKELELGRRFTPELYVGLLELDAPDGSPGETAVVMRRFPDDALLERRDRDGLLDEPLVDALAAEVVRAHELCPSVPAFQAGTQLARQLLSFHHDFEELNALARTNGERVALSRVQAWVTAEHTRIAPLMFERAATGQVRECHGDLHLGNLVWLDGRPRLFDPIEFNDDFRIIDVAADLAFLVMDLAARGHDALARRLVERYVAGTGDHAVQELLPYHVKQRALVRAKVAMMRRQALGAGHVVERELAESEANRYLGLALDEHRRADALTEVIPELPSVWGPAYHRGAS